MRYTDIKKYFCAHIVVIIVYISILFLLWSIWAEHFLPVTEYTYPGEGSVQPISPGSTPALISLAFGVLGGFCFPLIFIEIIIRKFIIERFLSKLRKREIISFKFVKVKLNVFKKKFQWLYIIHTILFYFGLLLAGVIFISLILFYIFNVT